jgi:hypothetical protein
MLRQLGTGAMLLALLCPTSLARLPALPPTEPVLVLAIPAGTAKSPYGIALRMMYSEALRRVGYRLELVSVPAARASVMADRGEVDGEINRVFDYGERHPNLVRVGQSHFSVNFHAYGKVEMPPGTGWQALRAQPWRVDYVRGCKKCESELPKVVAPDRLSNDSTMALALGKVEAGRTDLLIDIEAEVDAMLGKAEYANAGIKKRTLLESAPMHAYLHQKHAALAPRLAQALAAMKKEGLIDEYKVLATAYSK